MLNMPQHLDVSEKDEQIRQMLLDRDLEWDISTFHDQNGQDDASMYTRKTTDDITDLNKSIYIPYEGGAPTEIGKNAN